MSQIRSRSPFRASAEFHHVAHLVLGGLALRLNLTFETLEDLQLALGAVLDHLEPGDERLGGEVTVAVSLEDGGLEIRVQPVDLLDELERGRRRHSACGASSGPSTTTSHVDRRTGCG